MSLFELALASGVLKRYGSRACSDVVGGREGRPFAPIRCLVLGAKHITNTSIRSMIRGRKREACGGLCCASTTGYFRRARQRVSSRYRQTILGHCCQEVTGRVPGDQAHEWQLSRTASERLIAVEPQKNLAKVTERRSLSALCAGEAASGSLPKKNQH